VLDAVERRSGTVYADWLTGEGLDVKVTVEHTALDPFRGYADAIRDELPVAVLDAFHVVKLGSTEPVETISGVRWNGIRRYRLRDGGCEYGLDHADQSLTPDFVPLFSDPRGCRLLTASTFGVTARCVDHQERAALARTSWLSGCVAVMVQGEDVVTA
jgi:hypothetical protein